MALQLQKPEPDGFTRFRGPTVAKSGDSDVGRNLDRLLASPPTNMFEVKATFRLGY